MHFASGGHPPALLLTADGGARYVETFGGQAIGISTTPRFESTRFRLAAGDTLVLYTDGLTEARTGVGIERLGEDALMEFALAQSPTTAATIVNAIRSLLEGLGEGLEDDAAVLAMGVPRPGVA